MGLEAKPQWAQWTMFPPLPTLWGLEAWPSPEPLRKTLFYFLQIIYRSNEMP